MNLPEIYNWQIGWKKNGVFEEDYYRENGLVYGNWMRFEAVCINCRRIFTSTADYEPMPMHFESLSKAYEKELKCKCGARYKLGEDGTQYELIGVGDCENENQLSIFNNR